MVDLENGNMDKVRYRTEEGARLTESLLISRPYYDAAIITPRICGVCPIIHNITALRGVEAAMGVKIKPEVILLRKLMLCCQHVDSHALHLFFLSLPDFLNFRSDLKMAEAHPEETKLALKVKDYSIKMAQVLSGRTVHPLASQVAGFKRPPNREALKGFLSKYDEVLEGTLAVAEIFRGLKYPNMEVENQFVAMTNKDEYAYYDGNMTALDGNPMSIDKFYGKIEEYHRSHERIKHTLFNGESYMVGALARLNLNYKQLNSQAKKFLKKTGIKLPSHNPFHNIVAQGVELIHFVEETKMLLNEYLKLPEKDLDYPFKIKAGKGVSASEAPRGTLFHYYEIDENGIITGSNIITPTAQLAESIEKNMTVYLKEVNAENLNTDQRRQEARKLIRAYDPCMTCSTH